MPRIFKSDKFNEHLGNRMQYISHYIRLQQNKILEPYGLTDRQARILVYLIHCSDRPLNQKDIEAHFHRVSSSITNILSTLEKKGFITRSNDQEDARKKQIKVTQAGIELEDIMKRSIENLEAEIRSTLSPEEYEVTRDSLDKIIDHLMKKEALS